MTEIHFQSIANVGRVLRAGALTSVELTQHLLDRIRAHTDVNAFVTITAEQALSDAKHADNAFAAGRDLGPLHGVPIAVKDLVDTHGVRTTYGSSFFEDHFPDRDAFVVKKLKEAGAVLLGKTGLHEFAYGMTGINDWYGPVRNPWHRDYIAGGSSSGSAAAVAAGLCFGAVGTDTGCSIRQPAHCCGIVGHKPTFGLVSKSGVFPLCQTMDHVGPMTRTVEDAALMLATMVGHDPSDPFSIPPRHTDGFLSAPLDVSTLTIGVIRAPFFEGRKDVVDRVDAALRSLSDAGANLKLIDMPGLADIYKTCRLTFAEALAEHQERLDAAPEKFSREVRDKLISAKAISGAAYAASQQLRRELRLAFEALLASCDAIAAPTSTIGAVEIDNIPDDFWQLAARNTGFADFTGQPAISVPCGVNDDGLPVGLMLTGRMHGDRALLQTARTVEAALDCTMRPPGY
ncbi:MAG: amidase [Pseudomonadota bacterium]